MKTLFSKNTTLYKTLRAILQGVIGLIIVNIDMLIGFVHIDPSMKPFIATLVVVILTPIMSELGGGEPASEMTDEEAADLHWIETGDIEEDAK